MNHPTYTSYRDSGEKWIGDIPSEWKVTKLGAVLDPITEKNRPELTLLSITRERGVIVRDVENSEENHNYIPDDLSGYKVLKKGQFGMNKMKAWQGSYGVSDHTGIVSPAYYTFDLDAEILPAYFHRAIRSRLYISYFGSASDGVRIGQWDLSKARMKAIPFLVPPPNEQKAIANFLDEKIAKIEAAISIKEQQIDLLKERKQTLIQNTVTRGLNPEVPLKNSGVNWIGQIPNHWEIKPILGVADVIDPNPSHRNPEYVQDGFPFISTQEFTGSYDVKTDTPRRVSEKTVLEQERRCNFIDGSLVFSRKGTIGAVRILPAKVRLAILDSLCVLNPKDSILSQYCFWTLSADYLKAQYNPIVRGAALPQLSVGRVRSLKIVLPPKEEQSGIVSFLETETGKIDNALGMQKKQIDKLKEYKASLINAAVTGKIRVT